MNLKEQFEANGFTFEICDDNIFSEYYKNIGEEGRRLVFQITPIPEVFLWIPDEDANGEECDGIKIILDVDTVEKAILVAECIAGIDEGF